MLKDQKVVERLAKLNRVDEVPKGIIALAKRAADETAFEETMLVLWGELEYSVDILIAREFEIDYADDKAAFLTNHTFEDKIEFLKQVGDMDSNVMALVMRFQKKRNELFHSKRGGEQLYFTLTKAEKKERMSDAWAAYIGALTLIDIPEEFLTGEITEEGQAADEPEP